MRALSFLFAALLGIALAMMTPALAGPRHGMPVQEAAPAAELGIAAAAAAGGSDAIPAPSAADASATETSATDATASAAEATDADTLDLEQISRAILDAIDLSTDPA